MHVQYKVKTQYDPCPKVFRIPYSLHSTIGVLRFRWQLIWTQVREAKI